MKKNLLMALAVATMFASCSKQDNGGTPDKTGKVQSLSVKIDMSKFTKSDDPSFTQIPAWEQLLLVVHDKSNAFVIEKKYTKVEFEALTGGKALLIQGGKVDLAGGAVTAYITTVGSTWGGLTAVAASANLPTLAKDQLDINNWQPSGFIKTGKAGTFANVPYHGIGTIALNGINPDTANELLEATVSLTPELGRIQVINTPQSGGVKNGYEVTGLKVSGVYINKITSGGTLQEIRTENGNTEVKPDDEWKTDYYTTGKPLVGMWDDETNRGYQIFDGNTPHVIVEVTYKLTKDGAEFAETYTGYLTITKFKADGAPAAGDLTVNKGNIYNIDLSKLQPSYDQIGDDPYDNTTYYDLIATVTVNPWTPITITPEL